MVYAATRRRGVPFSPLRSASEVAGMDLPHGSALGAQSSSAR